MSKFQHTLLPWYSARTGSHQSLIISEKTSENVAVTYNGYDDAEFITKACNAYDDLLAVCKAIEEDCMDRGDSLLWTKLGTKIRAAIAKAE